MGFSALCSQGPAKTAGLDSFREPLGENYFQAHSACWQNSLDQLGKGHLGSFFEFCLPHAVFKTHAPNLKKKKF